jgi:hypothetical protein
VCWPTHTLRQSAVQRACAGCGSGNGCADRQTTDVSSSVHACWPGQVRAQPCGTALDLVQDAPSRLCGGITAAVSVWVGVGGVCMRCWQLAWCV